MAPPDEYVSSADDPTAIPCPGRVFAIDPGTKRIGLAMSDPTQTIAQPLATLSRRVGKRFPLQRLKLHLDDHEPVGIVVGLPIAPDGSEDERAKDARRLGATLHTKTELPVAFWDERMTTARALSAVKDLGGQVRGRKAEVDSLAATVLLQAFLDSRKR
jgi:putative Holliday junction resolvase